MKIRMKRRLTDFFIKRAVDRLINVSFERERCFRSLHEAHDIVIFCEAKDMDGVASGLETLRRLKKNVDVCVYAAGKEVSEADAANARLVISGNGNKDTDVWGFPSPEITNNVGAWRADMLIDLTGKDCYPVKYLLLQHPSPFKAGIKRGEKDMYDFSISATGGDELAYLFDRIIFYLQTIRSK